MLSQRQAQQVDFGIIRSLIIAMPHVGGIAARTSHVGEGDRTPQRKTVGDPLSLQVESALSKLQPELRSAVFLRDLQKLTYSEIAEILTISERTARSRVARGYSELARLLKDMGVDLTAISETRRLRRPELPAFQKPVVPPPVSIDTRRHEKRGYGAMLEDEKAFIKDGVRYRPLSDAAREIQTHRTTLLRWLKDPSKFKFQGRPLQSYYFAPLDTYFISEESIQRATQRFIKWPSQKPAGPVTLGGTKDKSGFIGMSEAANIAGVSKRTMWLWCSQPEKAPLTDARLDVIKCTASDYFYIREKDAYGLRKFVPRSGLQRGRRPQSAPQP